MRAFLIFIFPLDITSGLKKGCSSASLAVILFLGSSLSNFESKSRAVWLAVGKNLLSDEGTGYAGSLKLLYFYSFSSEGTCFSLGVPSI